MVFPAMWSRYLLHKFNYSVNLTRKNHRIGHIAETQIIDSVWKNLFQGKLTFIHWNKGPEMEPTLAAQGGTLLVRKMPLATPNNVFVGDVLVLKDPEKPDDYLVRRLAAVEGQEMVSTDEKDTSFVLEEDECWVLANNHLLKPKEARDSRTFGPLSISDVIGRVIYSMRSALDHGPVKNSSKGLLSDASVLMVELDVDEMAKRQSDLSSK
ncbi:hypothetical protein QJS04_geneDACA015297 [Acorus gramineus]|uniref:Mitochondrial inner membrane protease subunit n=1 Tax=Acorus gramineus TaxID=55184 RepID=A0AAV9AUP4_ACOGR|nr:hypothetical protein QJS04_geneDACA015297 [Acorus gramineus]